MADERDDFIVDYDLRKQSTSWWERQEKKRKEMETADENSAYDAEHGEDLDEGLNSTFTKFIPLAESSRSPHLLYLENELKSAADALTTLGRNVVISEDNQSMTFETKSGDKATCRVKKVVIPQYQLINDMGDIIYASTSPDEGAIAWEIMQEYKTH